MVSMDGKIIDDFCFLLCTFVCSLGLLQNRKFYFLCFLGGKELGCDDQTL